MSFIPATERLYQDTERYNKMMQRQKQMNIAEKAKTTDQLLDIRQIVRTVDGPRLTIQQIICGLTDNNQRRIFTGAEVGYGSTGIVLLTYDIGMIATAKETALNICQAIKMVTVDTDYTLIEDERKKQSRETAEKNREKYLYTWKKYLTSGLTLKQTISQKPEV